MKQAMLEAPDTSIDPYIKDMIERIWDEEPNSIQILEVLDHCIHTATASGFAVHVMEIMLDVSIKRENTTYDELVSKATWRV
jgi:predicted RNase H-related nuclease YkuK (DUF458 family)